MYDAHVYAPNCCKPQSDCFRVDLWSGLMQQPLPSYIYIRKYNLTVHVVGIFLSIYPLLLPLPISCSYIQTDSFLYTQGDELRLQLCPHQTLST